MISLSDIRTLVMCMAVLSVLSPIPAAPGDDSCYVCATYFHPDNTWPSTSVRNSACASTDPKVLAQFIFKCPAVALSSGKAACRAAQLPSADPVPMVYRDCWDYTKILGAELVDTTALARGDASCFSAKGYLTDPNYAIPLCVSNLCSGGVCNPSITQVIPQSVWRLTGSGTGSSSGLQAGDNTCYICATYAHPDNTWPANSLNNPACGSTDPKVLAQFRTKCPAVAISSGKAACRVILFGVGMVYRDCWDYTKIYGSQLVDTTALARGDASCFQSKGYVSDPNGLVPLCVTNTCVGAVCDPSIDKPISKSIWNPSSSGSGTGSDSGIGTGSGGIGTGTGGFGIGNGWNGWSNGNGGHGHGGQGNGYSIPLFNVNFELSGSL